MRRAGTARTLSRRKWTFHHEPSGLVKGHDAGLYTFEHTGEAGWIRELLQNSLDARENSDEPVEIEINAQEIASNIIDAKGLRETFGRCGQHRERLGKVSSLFEQALDTFERGDHHSHLLLRIKHDRGEGIRRDLAGTDEIRRHFGEQECRSDGELRHRKKRRSSCISSPRGGVLDTICRFRRTARCPTNGRTRNTRLA